VSGPPSPAGPGAELPSFGKALFGGVLSDELVFPYPAVDSPAAKDLDRFLRDLKRFLDAKVDAAVFDREAAIPDDVIGGLAEHGVLGASIPAEYEGLGMDAKSYARVMETVAARDGGVAVLVGAHQSIGLKGIVLYGTEEQKRRWLPPAARGETLAAFALTEEAAGSDAVRIEARAERADGGEGWILEGRKIWIGNGHRAGVITVFAQTPVERDGATVDRMTAFVVEGDDEGLEIGRVWAGEKLGIRSSTQAELIFDRLRLGDDRVLGEVGRGFEIAMNVLNHGRLGLAAGCLGALRTILDDAVDHATSREQFGRPIAEHGLVGAKLAEMRVDAWVLEAMVRVTADLVDRGDVDFSLESAICKVYASEALWRAADEALQIAGGRGYMRDRPFERYLRDARINTIFEGTNEILRLFIALAGMERLADHLAGVGDALRDPLREIGLLTGFAFHRIADAIGTPRASVEVAEPLEGCLRYLERYVGALHRSAEDLIMQHGKDLPREQLQLARLADVAIDAYALAAAIARCEARIREVGEERAAGEIDVVRHFCRQAGQRIERRGSAIGENRDERTRRIAGAAIAARQGARG